jgi:hypothetical protein
VNKAEIISKTLKAMNLNPSEPQCEEPDDEEAFIISVLQDVLPDGVDHPDVRRLVAPQCPLLRDLPQFLPSLRNEAD